ncbi:unnamed protein product [Trichogramma brassicae]|uniref:Uncharacterized protein n=1 Tax=Trichogramma brassicae TaxID=86971 RepID=A0A6H5ICI8_9HYME|nr:unnamed protein product [Trichogramma brassicae]
MKKKTFENVSRSFKLSIIFSSPQGPIAQMKNSILKSRRASSDSPVDSYNRSATSPLHDEANGCRNQDRHAISSCGTLLCLNYLKNFHQLHLSISEEHWRIFEVRFFAWCGRACARGGAGTTQKEDPGYVISLRSGKKPRFTVRAGSDRITISRSPRRGLTRLAIDGAQHSHDEVRSENYTHKRAPDAGAKAQQERMMAPEARTTLTR